MNVQVSFKSNADEVRRALADAIAQGLEAIGFVAETHAKQYLTDQNAVDTGRLRNSVSHIVDGEDVYIGTNVEYAAFVELGTSKMDPRPYLAPAATQHSEEYKELMTRAIQGK